MKFYSWLYFIMEVDNENLIRQADEVEALSAIYGGEWCVVDAANRVYCINIADKQDKPRWSLCLQVHMPLEYPSHSPPEYQLNAPWLKGAERKNVEGALADIFCENIGESIIYLWVERIRGFLQDKTDEHTHDQAKSRPGRVITQTVEVEEEDYFDVSCLEQMGTSIHSASSDEDWECPSITSSEPITDRRSTFQAHLASVFHKKQVEMVIEKLYENKKIANATHNILAYRIYQAGPDSKSPVLIHGCDDDGETHAGSRMLHLLQILDARNVMVVVSRWFGGILLGSDRFKHISNCTRSILEQCGYLKEKDDKKVLHTGDKKKR
ncbi:hypothetical protein CHS0354_026991 [Potamilus streckersoni]|uniref:RWD domain-containing protein n=1 Tax=Potamilus streckersoni TaxID=2493646 RepID=A0AAE0VSU1_9BIVA|nr:hypothetical protein CHS0354_026991 [Potamilus streckersoni]